MSRILTIATVFVFYAFAISWGTIINVPADFSTIQVAIDSSSNGDTVLVQPNTYHENINFNGHNIVLGSLFLTTADTSYIDLTFIDGNSSGSVVTFENGEDSCTVITGFTIQNGSNPDGGGGISCINSSPVILYNIIEDNASLAYWMHGGVAQGGGIYCNNSSPTIDNNKITNNEVYWVETDRGQGGGIYCLDSNPLIINNMIYDNFSDWLGGGIYCQGGVVWIINNIIFGNNDHSGIHADSNTTIINSIIWAHYYSQVGGDPQISYCDIQDTLWPGDGNISIDPLFRDPDNSDFHLMSIACGDSADSPCIDAGDSNILDSLLDCSWGLGGLRSDMGAYGGGDSLITGIVENMTSIPDRFILLQNYPNPFNASTTIEYGLLETGRVRIDVYDLLGRRVKTLADEDKQAGQHQAVWDASDHSSGVYFYRLEAGGFIETKKMILLK